MVDKYIIGSLNSKLQCKIVVLSTCNLLLVYFYEIEHFPYRSVP